VENMRLCLGKVVGNALFYPSWKPNHLVASCVSKNIILLYLYYWFCLRVFAKYFSDKNANYTVWFIRDLTLMIRCNKDIYVQWLFTVHMPLLYWNDMCPVMALWSPKYWPSTLSPWCRL
jgi:hypothetical protein